MYATFKTRSGNDHVIFWMSSKRQKWEISEVFVVVRTLLKDARGKKSPAWRHEVAECGSFARDHLQLCSNCWRVCFCSFWGKDSGKLWKSPEKCAELCKFFFFHSCVPIFHFSFMPCREITCVKEKKLFVYFAVLFQKKTRLLVSGRSSESSDCLSKSKEH